MSILQQSSDALLLLCRFRKDIDPSRSAVIVREMASRNASECISCRNACLHAFLSAQRQRSDCRLQGLGDAPQLAAPDSAAAALSGAALRAYLEELHDDLSALGFDTAHIEQALQVKAAGPFGGRWPSRLVGVSLLVSISCSRSSAARNQNWRTCSSEGAACPARHGKMRCFLPMDRAHGVRGPSAESACNRVHNVYTTNGFVTEMN